MIFHSWFMFKLSAICCNTRKKTRYAIAWLTHQWRIWCPHQIIPTLAAVLLVSIVLISLFNPPNDHPFWANSFGNFLASYCLFWLKFVYLNLVLFTECYADFGKQPSATGNDAKVCLIIKSKRQVIPSTYFFLSLLYLKFQHNWSKGN